jgi:hypothetical protein
MHLGIILEILLFSRRQFSGKGLVGVYLFNKRVFMSFLRAFLVVTLLGLAAQLAAQNIFYSDPDRTDPKSLQFELIGKMGGQFLVYKSYRDQHFIVVFDNNMRTIQKIKLPLESTRLLSTDFLVYPEFAWFFYQYYYKGAVYAAALKIDPSGNPVGKEIILDSTQRMSFSTNKIYSVINSEDKQQIMVFKINTSNNNRHILTTCLFNKELTLQKKSVVPVEMPQNNDFLSEFTLFNDGELVCIRASGTSSNDNINKVTLIFKDPLWDAISTGELQIKGVYLDDVRLRADNINKHYVISSFFSKTRRGNIDGLYYAVWDKSKHTELMHATTLLSDELRADAKGEGSLKTAFNDFYINQVIMRRDGGFILTAELVYTSTRGGNLNRWDYLYGSPFRMPGDYFLWTNPMGFYPWGYNGMFNTTNFTRYYAENVLVISFDPSGRMEWSNIIRKSQFDDNSDNMIGFGMVNTGDQLHFLFNAYEKRIQILSDQSISSEGQLIRNPTFKNLDRGFEFMPRYAKQVGLRQVLIPCQYRGFICFAKIEF